ncbi:MAG: MBL fold metallo-hydrolase [Deltaproteobacteria bacterium]|nr:MBL fold metallo-hydrolase [Deltaproteobacteria bacterium]
MKARGRKVIGALVLGAAATPFVLFACAELNLVRGAAAVETEWRNDRPPPLGAFGATRRLVILPLVDHHVSSPTLLGEPGVSYLVTTDGSAVLFDLGLNARGADPSPLQHNLATLSVAMSAIDTIVISHRHGDHTGGQKWAASNTFSFGVTQTDLASKRAFVPVPMSYPGLSPVLAHAPTRIAPGVATTGTIPRQLLVGRVDEQALAVNVDGKGIVLIVGCGHQTIERLLARASEVFREPIYGIVGGLHYPVPNGRLTPLGINMQLRVASGSGPFHPITVDDVEADIARLKELNLGYVAVGGHDSSDEVIERFRSVFGPAYHDLAVGSPLTISE